MKDIPGFEKRYAATSCGKIWSYLSGKFLTPKIVNGYAHVDLFDIKHQLCQRSVHRLVAATYIQNPNGFPCVNHKDENRINNSIGNLEWCSYQYNNTYGNRIKKAVENMSEEGKKKILDTLVRARSKPVICVETGELYSSAAEAERQTGVNSGHIGSACAGNRKRAGGYHWQHG